MLKIGQTAPDFTLPADTGAEIQLSNLNPAPVVLFFYPKDDTPGCTLEARAFTALMPEFVALGTQVYGISKDSIAKHCKFRDKYELAIPLLSDAEGDVCENYGVWGAQKMFGKEFMGITRTTVLIDGAGKFAQVWPKVKVENHAEEVLLAVRELLS